MARYLGTLLMTVPPRTRMRANSAFVTSARISTVTTSSLASASDVCRRASLSACWALAAASRSWELSFRWAGGPLRLLSQQFLNLLPRGRRSFGARLGGDALGPHQGQQDGAQRRQQTGGAGADRTGELCYAGRLGEAPG